MEEAKWYDGLEPRDVLEYFDRMDQIPRGSGNLEAISDAVVSWITGMGLVAEKDEYCNVKAFKPATPGYEDAPAVMLAAHLDMVCAKVEGSDHDFTKDPIRILLVDGDIITADGTSLGADDAMGAAMILAILADKEMAHPALEAVFTADEETDMGGALNMDYSDLKSTLIISLDGDPVGIAGHGELDIVERFRYMTVTPVANSEFFKITISGLKGGHSGLEARQERGNAVLLLNRFLAALRKEMEFRIARIEGGNESSTAFAYHAEAVIEVPEGGGPILEDVLEQVQAVYSDELRHRDEGITISAEPCGRHGSVVSLADTDKLIAFLTLIPDGIMSMSFVYPGLMESSINTGVLFMEDGAFVIRTTIRSAGRSRKEWLYDRVCSLGKEMGIDVGIENDLPQWDMKVSDEVLEICKRIYPDCGFIVEEATGECGIFMDHMPEASAITLQCPYSGAHSTEEQISASQVKIYYDRLKAFLAELR